jgi:DNA-binding response OmpR family regulator
MQRLLLIDDDPVFARIAAQASEAFGFTVQCVGSLEKLKHSSLNDYDGYLIDYDLLDGTGEEVIQFLKSKHIDRPLAMISSTDLEEQKFETQEHYSYIFISKWQSTDDFMRKVKDLMAESSANTVL